MTNLYYTYASGSVVSNIRIVPDNSSVNETIYQDVTLDVLSAITASISASANSGSIRVYVKSGSLIYASFPLEQTNIYYYTLSNNNFTASVKIKSFAIADFSVIGDTSTFSQLEIVGLTSSSYSSSVVPITISSGSNYVIKISGSSVFYSSYLQVINSSLNSSIYYTSSFNSNISTSFNSSMPIYSYTFSGSIINYPYIALTYEAPYYPVANTSSLDSWNSYLKISGSFLSQSNSTFYSQSNSTFYIGGSNLSSATKIDDDNSIGYSSLQNVFFSGLNGITELKANASSLSRFPDTTKLPNLKTLEIYDQHGNLSGSIRQYSYLSASGITTISFGLNLVSGSIADVISVLPNSIVYLDCGANRLTGSIPNLSSSLNLKYFDCSYNILSGSIIPQNQYSLLSFNCSYNALTGSIPPLQNMNSLEYFYCQNNALTGSLPELSSSLALTAFYCSNNKLNGIIPSLYNTKLSTFYCNDNAITTYTSASGTIVGSSSYFPVSLTYFDASNNSLSTGSVNSILHDFRYSGATNGYLNLSGSGNAPPSAVGQTDKTALQYSLGWEVYTN